MWFFNSPQIVFGEHALEYLEDLPGSKALLVTDPMLHGLGFSERVRVHLERAGIEAIVFAEVEPEPSLQVVQRGVEVMRATKPEWIIGLGGGSAMDAAKAIWAFYERPDLVLEEISPIGTLGICKAKMIAIPTTSGSGSEANWITILTDKQSKRKQLLANRELMPTIAIVDPEMSAELPTDIAADSGLDALTHAVEGYSCNWHNDFSDGLCLKAARMVFDHLRAAIAGSRRARARMANAATIAGLGFGNSGVALAHAMGNSFGVYFGIPHGRAVSLFLPGAIEFATNGGVGRHGEMARFLNLSTDPSEEGASAVLVERIRTLMANVKHPGAIAKLGISTTDFDSALDTLVSNAELDACILTTPRIPDHVELQRLFEYAYVGKSVDF